MSDTPTDPWGNPVEGVVPDPPEAPVPAPEEVPEGMSDLVAEVSNETTVHGFPYEFGGHTFRIRPQFDLRLVAALQRGNFDRALVLLLGRDQVETLLALDSDEPFTDERLKEMVEMVAKANGTSLPESSASSTS